MTKYQVYGIRHHGPGSARSLLQALAEQQPDCVLIEGPPEAQEALSWVGHAELKPPIALLIYRPQEDSPTGDVLSSEAVYYPFAEFSPEWQAMLWAHKQQAPVRWMDLPQSIQMAQTEEPELSETAQDQLTTDPFTLLGQAAGYSDGERYWEDVIEHGRSGADVFAAITEMMSALREDNPDGSSLREQRREAYMRQTLRQALKDGFKNIAVICGAWHVPAIDVKRPLKTDKDLLKNLPKVKLETSWIPWTHSRLGWASGYGAGVESPGWYAHLWQHPEQAVLRWMARIAQLLRQKEVDVSSAHLIEAVRLAEALASLRDKPQPSLTELNEATVAVLSFGQTSQLELIRNQLIVGHALGTVPADLPDIPLQRDLDTELKRLRLKILAEEQYLKLDLRKERDRDKSALLHRLQLLDVPWGELQEEYGRKGSFGETWKLDWEPEYTLRLIEAGVWGPTLSQAAAARSHWRSGQIQELSSLTSLLDQVLLADLSHSIPRLMQRLADLAAVTSDVLALLKALPPLGRMLRYGSVRQLDTPALQHMLDGLLSRVCLGLPAATHSLDEAAARDLLGPISEVHQMLRNLQVPDWLDLWLNTLELQAQSDNLQGLLSGYFSRLLFDLDRWSLARLETRLARMTSPGTPLKQSAAWIEGLLQGSGLLLVHHDPLLALLDGWLNNLSPEAFIESLPLLRRSFARFADPERRQIGELVRQRSGPAQATRNSRPDLPPGFAPELARMSLPILQTLLGAPVPETLVPAGEPT